MKRKTDILVLGNGAAGSSAAFAAKKADPSLSVLVLSKENEPVYSAPALPDLLSGELTREKVLVRTWEEYEQDGIEVLCAEAAAIDPGTRTVTLADGDEIAYRDLILAAGSQPIQLRKMQGTSLPGNFVMKTMADIEAIASYSGKSAVVVGSGAIGIEGSMALKARGFERVTMVEALDWLSPKSLDKETSDQLKKALESFGVEVLTGEAVQAVLGEKKAEGVVTSKRTIPCDLVLWGIGMRPDVQLAKEAGIALGETGGILVDEFMRTSDPHIYACGDCAQSTDLLTGQPALHLFWEPAQRGGFAAGANAAGQEKIFQPSAAVFLTNKGGLSILALGKTEEQLAEDPYVLQEEKDGVFRRLLFEDGRLAGVQMLGTLQDADLFFAHIRKNAQRRKDAWDLTQPVPDLERVSVKEAIWYLRKQRRNAFVK
ncbi:MAG: NAD(P)/FAD-dependent oxidoreductase [Firmicutes bacterium]|nr:NAD(P)/FAD-dependent oxidoreductase [Bacillota bacterium]MBR0516554.1 NAD(P)/FAD-dependent oxidoreductase [Bacillota bacterium]